ncbi:prophage tail fiber N-terminal domain-containing protein [Salmonella enterica]|uniref:prophage tail fiber N-terminal domain-containing protein n=1 Tax=Salmonella enterica TaxID=28901 RepID=UPI0026DD90F3|nr:prophage tail fiber N-terminal domain-containing protein [Salmonella enterica]MDO3791220.1 prophage tail fiber N-terminal domain-containing protein [Salmonella enterica]MDO3795733.1 prophage tail fiber N-terminal domain-containing protein [Salmonella enterica]MDO3800288.1 prophage tail fiber N-terminal domain-containing protein [Salmonella enterica]MDO3841090.1 prophage tail fiber N-terminal domain-containing protein [Salmonella enterica]MDO3878081.1 prophage tail fiber N-terminal domain-co
MPVLISGVLKDATGTPVQNCTIQLKACRTSTTVVVNTVASENPDDAGRYSMDVEQGQYTVTLLVEGYPPSHAGVITVYDDSKPGTLNDFLGAMTEDDVRPEALRRFEAMVEEVARQASEASRNATAAGQASEQAQTSAGQAAESATAAVNAAGAAEASATQAASSAASAESSAGTATTKAGEASASAASADTARTAAAASAAAAKTSETNADASRIAAGDSAAAAAASATAAQTSAARAGASETAAKTSETQAASSAGDAGASATAAAASEKAAAASAAAAKTSETNAATSASTAAASATAASSSASEASTHAAASDTSASLAAQSSTAAGAAATRAEDAAKRAEDIADVISLEDASLTKKGIVKLSSATDSDSEALAATPKAVHAVMDEVQTKAPLDSPVFTGTPTTPTPPDDAKGLQTANAEFVRKLIAALVGSVPESLDTLQELADALGNDPNFATTVLNKLAGKQPLDETLTALSGKSVDGLIEYVGLRETINSAAGAMQKSQNGGDIPDKDLFVRRIGATRAFDGAVNIGGDDNPWTTAEFISWLESCGAFNHPYWMCRGSWSYAHNKIITDTGCGNICLAGAVIEVMGVRGAMTIRVTTPTTTSGGGVASAQFTYINNGDGYSPGWRRDFNTVNKPAADEMGALSVNGGRINGALGIGTDNALGGNSIVLGDNDTGLKQNSDGVLDVYANNALVARLQPGKLYVVGDVLAGDGRKLSLTSDNNSSLNARFNLWGDANRPTVIELDDDQGWQYYSQRNPDGSIRFMVNGEIFTTSSIHAGANTISTDGNIYGSLWGGWLNDWINNTIINRFVQDIRLGGIEYAQAWNGPGYNDTPGYVITGVTNGNSDELIDGVHRRPLQKLIGGVWYNVASI